VVLTSPLVEEGLGRVVLTSPLVEKGLGRVVLTSPLVGEVERSEGEGEN